MWGLGFGSLFRGGRGATLAARAALDAAGAETSPNSALPGFSPPRHRLEEDETDNDGAQPSAYASLPQPGARSEERSDELPSTPARQPPAAARSPTRSPSTRGNPAIPVELVPLYVRKTTDVAAARANMLNPPPVGMPLDCPIDLTGTFFLDRQSAVAAATNELLESLKRHSGKAFALRKMGYLPAVTPATCQACAKWHGQALRTVCNLQGQGQSSVRADGTQSRASKSHRCRCPFAIYLEECKCA
jgi:hypothetical protein